MVWSCCVPGSGSGGGNGLRDDSYNAVSPIGKKISRFESEPGIDLTIN